MKSIEEILQHYEGVIYKKMDKYCQFTIDYIDDAIIDLPEESEEVKDCLSGYSYRIENLIEVLKDGIDKNLFINILKDINKLNN